MTHLHTVVAFLLVAFSAIAFAQEIDGNDIYESNDAGERIEPLKPSSQEAGKLVSLFMKTPPASFARADNLVSYLSLGDRKYLLTTSGVMPSESGIFLANLRRGSIEQLIYGDYEVLGPRKLGNSRNWFLVKSGGGKHGIGGTALSTIVISRHADGRVVVDSKDIVVVSWDMEEGLCGSRIKDGKGGDIDSYAVVQEQSQPKIIVKVTEQDCQSKQVTYSDLRFTFQGHTFEPDL